jgi:hypothetical protein
MKTVASFALLAMLLPSGAAPFVPSQDSIRLRCNGSQATITLPANTLYGPIIVCGNFTPAAAAEGIQAAAAASVLCLKCQNGITEDCEKVTQAALESGGVFTSITMDPIPFTLGCFFITYEYSAIAIVSVKCKCPESA